MITKRARLWLCGVLVSAIAVGAFTMWRYDTPKARAEREFALACGKFRNTNAPSQIDIVKVMDHMKRYASDMGTNAIPILLEWLEEGAAPPSALRRQGEAFGKRMKIQSVRFWRWTHNGEVWMRAMIAAETLPLFEKQADWTVPRLQQIAGTNTLGAALAWQVLARIWETGAHRFVIFPPRPTTGAYLLSPPVELAPAANK